jgi:predicted transposase YdaD
MTSQSPEFKPQYHQREGREEGRDEGREGGRKEERKGGRKEEVCGLLFSVSLHLWLNHHSVLSHREFVD